MYHLPPGVDLSEIDGRPVLSTEQGGQIAIDQKLLALWKTAIDKDLPAILAAFKEQGKNDKEIRAGVSCLAEAGLLKRGEAKESPARVERSGELVSIVIVAHNSLDWLGECFASLHRQTYQPLEILLVDNASEDGTEEWVLGNYLKFRYFRIADKKSFASALNFGVDRAEGEYILLLNPDTKLEENAVAEMFDRIQDSPDCAAVAAKLKFMWAPEFLNGLGNRVGAFSWGEDNGLGHLDLGQFDDWEELPSACFAAAMIAKRIWREVGPADEDFPMYYEDSEWSYRARGRGFRVIAAPKAVVYHSFSGRIPVGEKINLDPAKLENVVYGRLRFSAKLLDQLFFKYFLSYLVADAAKGLIYFFSFRLSLIAGIIRGWARFVKDLPKIFVERKAYLTEKISSDEALFSTQKRMPEVIIWRGLPELTWDLVVNHYLPLIDKEKTITFPELPENSRPPRLLIISHDVIDEKMAGPGMRYIEMGKALSGDLQVSIAVPKQTSLELPEVELKTYQDDKPGGLKNLVDESDVVLISSYLVERFPFLWRTRARIVVDFYDPFVLENLHYYLDEPAENQNYLNQQSVEITNKLARIGDFYICGNERQRDFWLGVLTANRRVNPKNYRLDPELRSLIDVVGIGYPDRPIKSAKYLRGVHPQVPEEAKIILWGGGIWNWLDPLTLIRAWPKVVDQFPLTRLVFLGTRHPNPEISIHKMAEQAQQLADEIGEKDKSILFFDWLSYTDRELLLSEANIGVTLHPVHVETRYSIRTRMMDYFWAKLPVIVTEGDITSEWVQEYQLGEVVPPFRSEAVTQAIISMLDKPKASWEGKFDKFAEIMTWKDVVAPLRNYCLEGTTAPDNEDRGLLDDGVPSSAANWKIRWARARFILRSEGWGGLSHRTWRYIQRNLANTN
jgi:GT2 family glycosyltransferase/glycosyltransferase involved in cell wall biosynthesis